MKSQKQFHCVCVAPGSDLQRRKPDEDRRIPRAWSDGDLITSGACLDPQQMFREALRLLPVVSRLSARLCVRVFRHVFLFVVRVFSKSTCPTQSTVPNRRRYAVTYLDDENTWIAVCCGQCDLIETRTC